MQISSVFLDKEQWSIYATLNVALILLLFLIAKRNVTYQIMILMSLVGMMKGNLLPKIIYTCFLSFLIYDNSHEWKYNNGLLIIGVVITHYIKQNHFMHTFIWNNTFFLWIFRAVVMIWILIICKCMVSQQSK